jgi:hypothetical protein
MNEPNEKKRPRRNIIWANMETIDDAKWATKQAMIAAIVCASVTALFSVLSLCGVEFVRKTLHVSGLSLIDAGIFGLIAVYLSRHSRFAAWCGLGVYLIERVYAWSTVPGSRTNILLPIIFTLAFITGVRGAHAFHRLSETTPPEAERMVA